MLNKTRFPSDTAGSKVIAAFPRAKVGDKVGDIKSVLVEQAETFETIDYVYVVDDSNVLQGVFSIREIHNAQKPRELKKS